MQLDYSGHAPLSEPSAYSRALRRLVILAIDYCNTLKPIADLDDDDKLLLLRSSVASFVLLTTAYRSVADGRRADRLLLPTGLFIDASTPMSAFRAEFDEPERAHELEGLKARIKSVSHRNADAKTLAACFQQRSHAYNQQAERNARRTQHRRLGICLSQGDLRSRSSRAEYKRRKFGAARSRARLGSKRALRSFARAPRRRRRDYALRPPSDGRRANYGKLQLAFLGSYAIFIEEKTLPPAFNIANIRNYDLFLQKIGANLSNVMLLARQLEPQPYDSTLLHLFAA